MEPAIRAGSFALIHAVRSYTKGDVVLFKHGELMLKRIADIQNGQYYLLGDNPNDSIDSRSLGWIPHDKLLGKVILK